MNTFRSVSGRSTEFRTIATDDAHDFIEKYHRQKALRLTSLKVVSVGLYLKEELLAVAQFCSPRTARMKREYSTELLRMAFKEETRVVGGASKLIKNYIKAYDPSDIFTYQDTTGETTDVYAKAGLRLVRQASKKKYLVAPEKTLDTAQRGEYYTMAQVVTRGPDALIGTALGEVLRDDGKRKTNPELFTEELGWHIEETSGDRVYEWINTNRTFYTYKITATDSDKYYYGVSHLKKAQATLAECKDDGYFGSGGKHARNKFTNWKAKHSSTLVKAVLVTYSRQAQVYEAEKILVGTLHSSDPNCLNSTTGGKDGGLRLQRSIASRKTLICPIHGAKFHQGNICATCNAEKRFTLKECAIHGLVKHTGAHCVTCMSAKTYAEDVCEIHGLSVHKAGRCVKCRNNASLSLKECSIHGETKHIGDKCYNCISINSKVFTEKLCSIHGLTTFRGDSCGKCSSANAQDLKECSIHGLVSHKGNSCSTCAAQKGTLRLNCKEHGETVHQGGQCNKCLAKKLYSKRECLVHGLATFRKDSCIKCLAALNMTTENCERHGFVKHQKGKCCNCTGEKSSHTISHTKKAVVAIDCRFCNAV